MLKMVDGTGIIGVDMVCPLGGTVSPPQPPNYDRVEMEGTGMLVLPNSLNAPLERLEFGGKTGQVQTSGKQMLNEELLKSLSNYTSNGSDYYYYRISGLEVGKKYTISRGDVKTGKNALLGISVNQESTNKAKFLVYDGLGTGYNNASITWEQTTGEYVDILFSVSGSVTSTTQERLSEFWGRISYVQLEKGTTATPYEPYTGGKPSPSQEYQQEIKNVGKWNEGTQKYEVDVKITNAEQNWSKEQTLTLTSDRPITKWDRLVEQGGQIGWLYAGVVIDRFDGQSNKISIANKQGNVKNFSILFENVPNGNGNGDIYVDRYRAIAMSYTKAEFGICCNWNSGVKFFSAPNENVTTVQEFKTWLAENPLVLVYETTSTEFVPLPQSEQNAIRALKTYYPTTVIAVDGGELDPDIKVTYRKEI